MLKKVLIYLICTFMAFLMISSLSFAQEFQGINSLENLFQNGSAGYDEINLALLNAETNSESQGVSDETSKENVSVSDFGAAGDGITNDTASIQSAIDYVANMGGGVVNLSNKVYAVSGLKLKDNVTIVGKGKKVSGIKLLKNSNNHVIQAGEFDVNANGINRQNPVGCKSAGLKFLFIDGNKSNQTVAKNGFAYYGIDVGLEEVEFKNAKGINLYLESPGSTYSVVVGQNLQHSIRHIECHDGGLGNLYYNGQSDSNLIDILCYQTGTGAGQFNAKFGSKGCGARVYGMHCWGTSDYGIISEAPMIEFTGCHVESAAIAKIWAKKSIMWHGGRIYEVGTNTNAVGFKLDNDYNNITEVTATNINGGLVDTSAGGVAGQNSKIEILGYTKTAGATLYKGSIPSTTKAYLRLFGATRASLDQNPARIIANGGINMNSTGIDNAYYIAGRGWEQAAVDASNTLTVLTSFVVINPGSSVTINDILSKAGASGIIQVTIRNSGKGSATFKHNASKLRNIGGLDKVLNQYDSITYVYVSGTVWQQVAGK